MESTLCYPDRIHHAALFDQRFDEDRIRRLFPSFRRDYLINKMDITTLATKYALRTRQAAELARQCDNF